MYNIYTFVEIISDPIIDICREVIPALADGAKYSLSSRGKSRLQISTLRSRVELTDSNCSRRENPSNDIIQNLGRIRTFPLKVELWTESIASCQIEKPNTTSFEVVFSYVLQRVFLLSVARIIDYLLGETTGILQAFWRAEVYFLDEEVVSVILPQRSSVLGCRFPKARFTKPKAQNSVAEAYRRPNYQKPNSIWGANLILECYAPSCCLCSPRLAKTL
ncbi:hypothetical protein TNCV_773591 [Trichonephila clavipes]|nr:hypothetical protein TNCV_773591 [Trichonephila clavipes]